MKKFFLLSVFTLGLMLMAHLADAQVHFYVNVEPTPPVYVHPVAPSPRHVWVADEWVWTNGAYVHHPGYWQVPPHGYHTWVNGHWIKERGHGSYWVAGHWHR